MNWFAPMKQSIKLDDLVAHYRRILMPKPGRRKDKALAEIQRQRAEKLDYIERLRAEAGALFVLERELASTSQQLPVSDLL